MVDDVKLPIAEKMIICDCCSCFVYEIFCVGSESQIATELPGNYF